MYNIPKYIYITNQSLLAVPPFAPISLVFQLYEQRVVRLKKQFTNRVGLTYGSTHLLK